MVSQCAGSRRAVSLTQAACRKELHATEGAVEVRRARRRLERELSLRLEEAVTDERVGLFTPDKDGGTHTSRGHVAVIAARRATVCGEVGRVHTLYTSENHVKLHTAYTL